MLALFFCGEFLLHIPCWLLLLFFFFLFLSGEFLFHILCWLCFYLGSFSYTFHACLIFLWGVSLTHPIPVSFFLFSSREVLLHIPCCLYFALGSFSFTSGAGFVFNLGSCSYTPHACFIFLLGVSLPHPMLASFLSGEFLLHIPC